MSGRAQVSDKIEEYTAYSQGFELTVNKTLRTEKLEITETGFSLRVRYPEAVRFDSEGSAEVNGHLLRSPWAPAEFGAPFADGSMLTLSATVAIPGPGGRSESVQERVRLNQVTEDRNHIKAYDEMGAPVFRLLKNQINSGFSIPLSILEDTSVDRFVIALTVTDDYGNTGTHTATVTR